MARETKAQRLEREAAEKLVQQAAQAATYPQRLMAMLERAMKANFELTVSEAMFFLEDRDDRRDRTIALTLTYSEANEEALQSLDWRVELKEEAEREAMRRVMVRNQALNKLSLEEREILGLM